MTYRRKNGICPLSPAVFAVDIVKIALLSPGAKNPFRFFAGRAYGGYRWKSRSFLRLKFLSVFHCT
jgi:hypothetical protein